MFETLFGEMNVALKFFIAFVVVLGLIGLTAWVVRRFGSDRLSGAATRGRQPRLAVIDAASIDSRRRLVIIRRDNVEHLLMIGGATDVVVETNIVRSVAAQREAARGASGDTLPRAVPLGDNVWPLQPQAEPARAQRADDQWTEAPPTPAPAPRPSPRSIETLAGLAAELSNRETEQPAPRTAAPDPARYATPPVAPAGDQNLAEMAQRLEASLAARRPAAQAATAARPADPRNEPAAHDPVDAKPVEPRTVEARPTAARVGYESLEQEMASLLGRPKASKT